MYYVHVSRRAYLRVELALNGVGTRISSNFLEVVYGVAARSIHEVATMLNSHGIQHRIASSNSIVV